MKPPSSCPVGGLAIEPHAQRREVGEFTDVDDPTFSVTAGEGIGFLGPNESTTIKMLYTPLRSTADSARVNRFALLVLTGATRSLGHTVEIQANPIDDVKTGSGARPRARLLFSGLLRAPLSSPRAVLPSRPLLALSGDSCPIPRSLF